MTTPSDADREAAQQLHRSLTLAPRHQMGYALDEDRIVDAIAAARAEGEQRCAEQHHDLDQSRKDAWAATMAKVYRRADDAEQEAARLREAAEWFRAWHGAPIPQNVKGNEAFYEPYKAAYDKHRSVLGPLPDAAQPASKEPCDESSCQRKAGRLCQQVCGCVCHQPASKERKE